MTTLVGTGEIKTKHGLERVQVFRLIAAGDWPEPLYEGTRGRLWDESVVDERVRLLRQAGRLTKKNEIIPWRYLKRPEALTA
jgi:hypothetical protein